MLGHLEDAGAFTSGWSYSACTNWERLLECDPSLGRLGFPTPMIFAYAPSPVISIGIKSMCVKESSIMPEKETLERAKTDEQEGKSPSTQAGEFVREEMHHIREGKHGAQSAKQAIAIGLSKARRAGVKLSAPKKGRATAQVRKKAEQDSRKGQSSTKQKTSAKR